MSNSVLQEKPSKNTKGRGQPCLVVHGHFYQPPREDPFTSIISQEEGAAPHANYNEKITAECYRPNAMEGNFASMSFDMGPTLAGWLQKAHPDVYEMIIDADRQHVARYGVGNAMAHVYNHTILPLATTRDKHTQILWGLRDFRQRYGREARGMWLAETAVDLECLEIMAQYGVTYTVLAPWQAAIPVDQTEPYLVQLEGGRSITVFFYKDPASGEVSFDSGVTQDANRFAQDELLKHLNREKCDKNEPQLILIATDGELYGHHQRWREKFLSWLLYKSAPSYGFEVCSLERYLQLSPPKREVRIRELSSWSCHHGVARWQNGCSCDGTAGEEQRRWKGPLRDALTALVHRADRVFEQGMEDILYDPWAARNDYLALRNGWDAPERYWFRHSQCSDIESLQRARDFLEAEYCLQMAYTSCGFFFEDVDRIEPRNNLAFARRAISLIWQSVHVDLQTAFVQNLQQVRSWKTGNTGANLYNSLPHVPDHLLPN